nr:MAG: hypothetical protein [Circular genetic element sp.]
MGVIPINFSPEVEVFIKGSRKGTRSQVVDRVMKKYIQAQLSDSEATTVDDCSIPQLINIVINRSHKIETHNQDWFDRALVLRDILIKHLEESA